MKYILLSVLIISTPLFSQSFKCLEIDNIKNIEDWEVLNKDFKSHSVVLLGEAPHNMPANTFFQTEFWIYLNKNIGTKTLLIEFGSSDAYMLNKYLQTGEFKYFNNSFYGFQKIDEAKRAIVKLYEYNKLLSKGEKLKVVGLDFEREPALTSSVYYFLQEFEAVSELEALTQKVKARFDTLSWDDPKPFLDFLRHEFPKYIQLLSQSSDWEQINELIFFESSREDFWSRDKYMVERFSKLPLDERYFGSFGTMHTRVNEQKVFAGLLQKDNNYKDNVLVINLHHENSMYKANKPIEYSFLNDIGFFSKRSIKKYLAHYNGISECDIFISQIIPVDKDFEKLKTKCDYIIFLKNQSGYTKSNEKSLTLDK